VFKKILIANRGEIALRILRACKELGIDTVAVHSLVDEDAMHVRLADESVCIGPNPSKKSYLNISNILAAAEITNVDAIHPGIGFLSENARFAEAVAAHNIAFIGPSPEHLAVMGNKIKAKECAIALGLPVVPGSQGSVENLSQAISLAQEITYPVMLKAVAGGGGKGMRIVYQASELEDLFYLAQGEAQNSFGNPALYMEKYLLNPRHIEFQILGDQHGNVVCLGERDCSMQRNHQKIIEEGPAFVLCEAERQNMVKILCDAMKKMGYVGVGTLEFLYEDGQFYFIEMNTRLQVEHPVTELLSGIDLVKEQIKVAYGEPLGFAQKDIRCWGHAIECRINAEDPKTFLPQPGTVNQYLAPGGPGVRVDSALFSGCVIPSFYDSLIAKLIIYGPNREECLKIMRRALGEFVIVGPKHSIPLLEAISKHPDMIDGNYHVNWLKSILEKGDLSLDVLDKDPKNGV
jgi:acetyl-CoA carboxylase, biotin carboxylase subunit